MPLGDHPTKGGPIVAKKGRYGPYVSHDGVNATLPADKTPETITLEEAVALLDARAERNAPGAACAAAQGQAALAGHGAARQSVRQTAGAAARQARRPPANHHARRRKLPNNHYRNGAIWPTATGQLSWPMSGP